MKKLILGFAILLCMSACNSDNDNISVKNLVGTWIIHSRDGKPMETNKYFINTFTDNGIEEYGAIYTYANGDVVWHTSQSKYNIVENNINITRTNTNVMLRPQEITSNEFSYVTIMSVINGIEIEDFSTYVASRVAVDYSNTILGMWEGKNTTQGEDATSFRLEYSNDGSFNYYYKNENGEWVNKDGNAGKYFLYGNLMVDTWIDDILTSDPGKHCESWTVTIDGNTMNWEALRENNKVMTYQFSKVQN